eukprot:1810881-Lingulodinium_polyedra.AAC.1
MRYRPAPRAHTLPTRRSSTRTTWRLHLARYDLRFDYNSDNTTRHPARAPGLPNGRPRQRNAGER